MKLLLVIIAWCALCAISWPLALLALLLAPLFGLVWMIGWLIALPFIVMAIAIVAVVALVKALLMLPARLLGAGASR